MVPLKDAISGLKINLDNSQLIPVGEVANVDELDSVFVCRIGKPPITYLSLPLESLL